MQTDEAIDAKSYIYVRLTKSMCRLSLVVHTDHILVCEKQNRNWTLVLLELNLSVTSGVFF